MDKDQNKKTMLEFFLFETNQLLEELENLILHIEKSKKLETSMDEIFRIMHTIKGSASMMELNQIALLTHEGEDLFYFIREKKPENLDYCKIADIVLEVKDFIKGEIIKLESGKESNGDAFAICEKIEAYVCSIKNKKKKNTYIATVYFEEDCQMENIRGYTILHNLKEIANIVKIFPEDIIENNKSAEVIQKEGFTIEFTTECEVEEIKNFFSQVIYLKEFELNSERGIKEEFQEKRKEKSLKKKEEREEREVFKEAGKKSFNEERKEIQTKQSMISVSVPKLDILMDLVGEMVIAEAMVTQNPDLIGVPLPNFYKASRQLRKITGELQDIAMSIRMVPLSTTFQKMNRIVRDMSKKLGKEVDLEIIGAETEVDKNIIEHLSDPLMHLIRNALDHGIETKEERKGKEKNSKGKITLEARNTGGNVWIILKDDGKGLDRDSILQRAIAENLVEENEGNLTDKDIYSYILQPGFSTKKQVTEFSGRGVGMDVVKKNIEKVKGTIYVDSEKDLGTTISIKIPLTLAIVEGMTIEVGDAKYTIPITAIKESFRTKEEEILKDINGQEMILIRDKCYPIVRLHELYKIDTKITNLTKGIITLVGEGENKVCIFSDALLGQQQVVVKSLPSYIRKVKGVAGCTLLGDGGISLILDVGDFIQNEV